MDEPEPTWEEARTALANGQPAELVRPPQVIRVVFTRTDGGWVASSPDVTGFTAGPLADQAECQREAVRLLSGWAGSHVTLDLSVAEPG